jgi:hypothetical protein
MGLLLMMENRQKRQATASQFSSPQKVTTNSKAFGDNVTNAGTLTQVDRLIE